jgi:hypothetical protein
MQLGIADLLHDSYQMLSDWMAFVVFEEGYIAHGKTLLLM